MVTPVNALDVHLLQRVFQVVMSLLTEDAYTSVKLEISYEDRFIITILTLLCYWLCYVYCSSVSLEYYWTDYLQLMVKVLVVC